MITSLLSAFLYLILGLQLLAKLFKRAELPNLGIIINALLAAALHAYTLLEIFQAQQEQTFGLFSALSLVSWLCVVILIAGYRKQNTASLLVFASPLAGAALILAQLFPTSSHITSKLGVPQLFHIVTSIAAYALLTLAAIQAAMMAVLESRLRKHPGHISPLLPPMQSMDHFLFQLLGLGFILLTLSMASAFIYLSDLLTEQPLHKIILSIGAWIVFATLLFGRFRFGWRGKTAVRWTLTGLALLMVGYFGSKLVIEVILAKT